MIINQRWGVILIRDMSLEARCARVKGSRLGTRVGSKCVNPSCSRINSYFDPCVGSDWAFLMSFCLPGISFGPGNPTGFLMAFEGSFIRGYWVCLYVLQEHVFVCKFRIAEYVGGTLQKAEYTKQDNMGVVQETAEAEEKDLICHVWLLNTHTHTHTTSALISLIWDRRALDNAR